MKTSALGLVLPTGTVFLVHESPTNKRAYERDASSIKSRKRFGLIEVLDKVVNVYGETSKELQYTIPLHNVESILYHGTK